MSDVNAGNSLSVLKWRGYIDSLQMYYCTIHAIHPLYWHSSSRLDYVRVISTPIIIIMIFCLTMRLLTLILTVTQPYLNP